MTHTVTFPVFAVVFPVSRKVKNVGAVFRCFLTPVPPRHLRRLVRPAKCAGEGVPSGDGGLPRFAVPGCMTAATMTLPFPVKFLDKNRESRFATVRARN